MSLLLSLPGSSPGSLPARRVGTAALLLPVLLALLAGCTGAGSTPRAQATPPVGCGMLAPRLLAGLLGPHARSARGGSLDALRHDGAPATCRSTAVTGGRASSVAVRVVRHPEPLALPALDCNQGWVFAGTPAKYVPACQQSVGRGGRTVLLARWGAYIVRVVIAREDRSWGGDPELGLALSEGVARRLGVPVTREAAPVGQSASGSSS